MPKTKMERNGNMYKEPDMSILILDYLREKEAKLLIQSLKDNLKFNAKIIYLSNSPECDYAKKFLDDGDIDQLIINKKNLGCGIGTRQLFHACMSKWSLYCQVDQWLGKEFTADMFQHMVDYIGRNHSFYCDLAGNQGHGQFSERAFLIETKKYLDIPGIDEIIGSPGPFANQKWGEKHVQEFMKENGLKFCSYSPLFVDNGKVSRRTYPCGAETLHFTDEKRLFILKPFKQKYYDFPNLQLTEQEWELALSGNWPSSGLIPEKDRGNSFIYWRD